MPCLSGTCTPTFGVKWTILYARLFKGNGGEGRWEGRMALITCCLPPMKQAIPVRNLSRLTSAVFLARAALHNKPVLIMEYTLYRMNQAAIVISYRSRPGVLRISDLAAVMASGMAARVWCIWRSSWSSWGSSWPAGRPAEQAVLYNRRCSGFSVMNMGIVRLTSTLTQF